MGKIRLNRLLICLFILLAAAIIVIICLSVLLFQAQKDSSVPQWQASAISEEEAASESNYDPRFMQLAIDNALNGFSEQKGGPIGAVIVKDGAVIASASNENALTGHGFSHAEMCALGEAMDVLGTKTLAGCELYTSAQPCLMCESAIAGADIKVIYYAATLNDMLDYGYADIDEYEAIRNGKNLTASIAVDVPNKLEPLEAKKNSKP